MRAAVEKKEKNLVELQIEVESDKVDQAIDKACKKLAKKYTIPGFRKGKVPKKILMNYIGKESIYNEALEEVLPNAYLEAVEEVKIEPIDQPHVDLVQMEEGQPLIFKARVEVKPDVTLGEYRNLEIEKEEVVITEKDVSNQLDVMRQRYAQMVAVEDEAREKDTAIIDFEGFINGEPFEGGKGENYSLVIGSNTFIPGFEDQLVGIRPGEQRELTVTFPEDYHQETLAGQEALFKVNVQEIKRKELAALDDEFAKDVSELETLEELKNDIKNKLKETAEETAIKKAKDQLIDLAVANAAVEIPPIMVDNRMENMLDNFEARLGQQGIALDQYLEMVKQTREDLRQSFNEDAIKGVKSQLVLEQIAKSEGIETTEEEVNADVQKMADAYQQPADMVRSLLEAQGNLASLKSGILLDKTVDFLYDNAKITTIKKSEIEQTEVRNEDEEQAAAE